MLKNKILKNTIAIQGIEGCFHQIAANNYFGNDIGVLPCLTFDELVFKVLEQKECLFGVMAIENSIAGSLLQNYRLLQENDLTIIGETYLRIEQNLIIPKGLKLTEIQEIHSHPMAIYQCDEYLQQFPHIKLVEMEDTALSVKNLQQPTAIKKAGIGSLLAADLYGMEVLEKSIETNKQNYTRFLIISKKQVNKIEKTDKSSIYLVLNNTKGSLAKVLDIIAKNNINLSKLQSFPILGSSWQYYFHLDIEYDSFRAYKDMLLQIKDYTKEIKILGNYKRGIA